MTLYLGKVSCDLHTCSSRVRVTVPGTDDIPLSVKASLNDYPRHLFKKDVTVEVEQCKHDGRKFRVTKVFDVVYVAKKAVNVTFNVRVPDADEFKKDQPMEKVKFYLNANYFENPEMAVVLNKAFGVTHTEYQGILHHGRGVTLICTTDQFARFLIYRNQNGIKNGFMDLNAKLIKSEPKLDAYKMLAHTVGVIRSDAKKVALALGYSNEDEIRDRLRPSPSGCPGIDVSAR